MEWVETPESSSIARFCYDRTSQILVVEFKNGRTYNYYEVPGSVFGQMVAASSKGQFFLKNIDGQYRYVRV
jgi:KTSC domain-containing protein